MRKFVVVLVCLFVAGCAGTAMVDVENIPRLETVMVVSYQNDTNRPIMADIARDELEAYLGQIPKPMFIPYAECSPAVGEVTKEMMSDPAKLSEFRRTLTADAFLFCTITGASIPEAVGGSVGVDPLGCLFGNMNVMYQPPPSVKMMASVDVISLNTGDVMYSKTCVASTERDESPDEELLRAATKQWAQEVMSGYNWLEGKPKEGFFPSDDEEYD
ncbi:hypothetical protein ACFL6S_00765 [Candidatus Poribacteria bacterium]